MRNRLHLRAMRFTSLDCCLECEAMSRRVSRGRRNRFGFLQVKFDP